MFTINLMTIKINIHVAISEVISDNPTYDVNLTEPGLLSLMNFSKKHLHIFFTIKSHFLQLKQYMTTNIMEQADLILAYVLCSVQSCALLN